MYPQPLIFGAYEDSGNNVSGNEEVEEPIVQVRVLVGVVDAEQDYAEGARDARQDGADGQALLPPRRIGGETPVVSEPALRDQTRVEAYYRHGGHGDEEGPQPECADV